MQPMISPDGERSGSRCSSKVRLLRLYSNCDDDAAQRFVMLNDRRGVRVLTFQIFVDGFAEQFFVANFCAAHARAQTRCDAEILVGGPDDHGHLIDQQFELRFADGFDRVRCDGCSGFENRDDVAVVVANRRVREANENRASRLCGGAREVSWCGKSPEIAARRSPSNAGRVAGGQEPRERLADDLGFGVTVEALRAGLQVCTVPSSAKLSTASSVDDRIAASKCSVRRSSGMLTLSFPNGEAFALNDAVSRGREGRAGRETCTSTRERLAILKSLARRRELGARKLTVRAE